MNVFGNSSKQLLQALTANAERETMDYVLQEMQAVLGEEMPEADAVRTYLQDPDKPTELSTDTADRGHGQAAGVCGGQSPYAL